MSEELTTIPQSEDDEEEESALLGLEALVTGVKEPVKAHCVIDFSPYFNLKPNSVQFHFESPSTTELFNMTGMMKRIKTQHPDWSEDFLMTVSLIVITCTDVVRRRGAKEQHIGPGEKRKLWIIIPDFIRRIPTSQYVEIMKQWKQAFPHLVNVNTGAAEMEKN